MGPLIWLGGLIGLGAAGGAASTTARGQRAYAAVKALVAAPKKVVDRQRYAQQFAPKDPPPPPPVRGVYSSQPGDTPGSIAASARVSIRSLQTLNPGMGAALAPGTPVKIPATAIVRRIRNPNTAQ